jgi:hypothetical protein
VILVQTDRNESGKTSVNSIIAWGEEYYGLVLAAARSAPGLPAPMAVAFAWLNESISPRWPVLPGFFPVLASVPPAPAIAATAALA